MALACPLCSLVMFSVFTVARPKWQDTHTQTHTRRRGGQRAIPLTASHSLCPLLQVPPIVGISGKYDVFASELSTQELPSAFGLSQKMTF